MRFSQAGFSVLDFVKETVKVLDLSKAIERGLFLAFV